MTVEQGVIVTGAGSGIGQAIAIAYAQRGARVLAVGRRADALERTTTLADGIVPFAADVREQPEAIVDEARRHLGRIDVLVNNAGVFALLPLAQAESARIENCGPPMSRPRACWPGTHWTSWKAPQVRSSTSPAPSGTGRHPKLRTTALPRRPWNI